MAITLISDIGISFLKASFQHYNETHSNLQLWGLEPQFSIYGLCTCLEGSDSHAPTYDRMQTDYDPV